MEKLQPLNGILPDDIPCKDWLKEIDLEHYYDTFITNCNSPKFDKTVGYLSRNRLKQLRLQDYPKMNIKSYDDAKALHEHVKLSLKFEFESPDRKKEGLIICSFSS